MCTQKERERDDTGFVCVCVCACACVCARACVCALGGTVSLSLEIVSSQHMVGMPTSILLPSHNIHWGSVIFSSFLC